MPAVLAPPNSLNHLRYFIVRCFRGIDRYELMEPGKAQSYILGNAVETREYFKRIGLEYLGGRAMDSAFAFGASQALVKENRAWGLDLCRMDLDRGIMLDRDIDEDRNQYDFDDDEVIVLSSYQHGK